MVVKILHIMIMVIMLKNHIEITSPDPRLEDIFNLYGITGKRQAIQGFHEYLAVCAEIQQGCHRHITADTCAAFQI